MLKKYSLSTKANGMNSTDNKTTEKTAETMAEKENQLVSEFSQLASWEERYQLLIEKGRQMPSWPENEKKEDLKVKGCQSQVWLKAEMKEGRIVFSADSDALISKGLISILIEVYSQSTPEEILNYRPEFIKKIGLDSSLSPSRANGLYSMMKQMQFYALAFQLKSAPK